MEGLGEEEAAQEGEEEGGRGRLGPRQPHQGPDQKGPEGEVEEAGEGAEEGVVGEAAVPEEAGVGPPKKPQEAPAPGRPAVVEVEVGGEEEAAHEVAQGEGEELLAEAQAVGGAEERGEEGELDRQVHGVAGHGGLWGRCGGGGKVAPGGGGPYNVFSTQDLKVLTREVVG